MLYFKTKKLNKIIDILNEKLRVKESILSKTFSSVMDLDLQPSELKSIQEDVAALKIVIKMFE